MILFIYGQDNFRSRQKLTEIIEHYKKIHKSGFNLKILDLKEKTFEEFENEVKSSPMFFEKKLLILKNSNSNSKFKEKFLKNIEKYKGKDKILLFFEESEVPKDKFFKELKKHSKFQEFKPLNEWELARWVKGKLEKYNIEIEKEAFLTLIETVGNDLWRMENEIKKLVTFRKNGKIKKEDVETLVSVDAEINIFGAIEAILKKNKKKALKTVNFLLDKGEKIPYLISVFKSQFRKLLIIKDLANANFRKDKIISKTKFHPFFVEKNLTLLREIKMERLERIYHKIFQLDKKIKSGKIPPRVGFSLFIDETI
jgi:DNA polymerase-3 subunit delta